MDALGPSNSLTGGLTGGNRADASLGPLAFRLARAYGVGAGPSAPPSAAGPARPGLAAAPALLRQADRVDVAGSLVSASPATSSSPFPATAGTSSVAGRSPASLRSLVAGVVPGHVDFSGDVPRAAGSSLPFYRHPADRNGAAVQADLGRRVDISG